MCLNNRGGYDGFWPASSPGVSLASRARGRVVSERMHVVSGGALGASGKGERALAGHASPPLFKRPETRQGFDQ